MSEKVNMLDYRIIGSGSSGNAVRIENIMIDCGLSYASMKDELYKCNVLFITHKHSDHLNLKTFKNVLKHHKNIKVISNYEVAEIVRVDKISNTKPIKTKNWTMRTFYVPHDVVTQGAVINFKSGIDVIYVTDSAGIKSWIKGKYDYLFIESNHDEKVIQQIDAKSYGYDVFQNAKRHTSTQESKAFYYLNRKSKDSKWIELHKSKRFYR